VKAWLEARGRGPVEVQQGKTGQFDVFVDGKFVYSRYETGRFPSDAELEKLTF
jgi:selT/selW/selH-like putative selenoprotein